MKKIFISLIILFSFLMITALDAPVPDDYPSSQPSARVKGLADAGTAIANNPSAAFWNPAAAATIFGGVLHISFANENNAVISEFLNSNPSVLGKHVSFVSFMTAQGGISYHPLYSVSYNDRYFADEAVIRDLDIHLDEYIITMTTYAGSEATYAVPILLGFNAKYLNGRFAETKLYLNNADTSSIDSAFSDISSGHGYGLDIGLLYSSNNFFMGISVKDVITHIYWSGDTKDNSDISYNKQIIPMSASMGISYYAFNSLLLVLDIDRIIQLDMPFIYKTGIEYTFRREFSQDALLAGLFTGSPSIRGGAQMKNFYGLEAVHFSVGLGYSVDNYRIDFAFSGKPDQYMQGGLTYQISANFPITL
ncbi:conjugal transfer protein TraF [candidate division WOR-3 bacterium]|nr:conjugal transfer protein TraF [candidate division WOR-3 bacterium]